MAERKKWSQTVWNRVGSCVYLTIVWYMANGNHIEFSSDLNLHRAKPQPKLLHMEN